MTPTMKTEKEYSLPSNVLYSLKCNWDDSHAAVICAIIGVMARTAVPFVTILLPKLVIDALTRGAAPAEFIASADGCAAAIIALS
jgi:hypothetical protein